MAETMAQGTIEFARCYCRATNSCCFRSRITATIFLAALHLSAAAALLSLPIATADAAYPSTDTNPKHVVVLLVDDLGYGDTGHMGAEFPTANIDDLALGGVRLNQSYVMQLCSPTRASLFTSRYAYNIGMDGTVLTSGDTRCINASVSTLGEQMSRAGVKTAFLGKYDMGYSSWACTAACRGMDYSLIYFGAAEDYYLHGSKNTLDLHENYEQAPQYRGEYSTGLFVRKGIEWIENVTAAAAAEEEGEAENTSTLLYLSFQAVHGPIEAPPQAYAGCSGIKEPTRHTYCLMMQALDAGIGNLTAAYRRLGIFDDTVFLFLADNGGMHSDGGYNVPLRGQKATVWEGGIRAQTFVAWAGLPAERRGSVYSGLAHVVDWGITLMSSLGHTFKPNKGQRPLDGLDLWPALTTGGASPRTEMLHSMRDSTQCAPGMASCSHRGELAFRRGPYKLIYGHPSLRGAGGDTCEWEEGGGGELNCWNGWASPKDVGPSRPPPVLPPRPGQPPNTSVYTWGSVFLFDIESDPLEEKDISAAHPDVVAELLAALQAYNVTEISQDVGHTHTVHDTELCGRNLACAVPWLPHDPSNRCKSHPAPPPTPPPPSPPPGPSPPHSKAPTHLTSSSNWVVTKSSLQVHGWACYVNGQPQKIFLQLDGGFKATVVANETAVAVALQGSPCAAGVALGKFDLTFKATVHEDFRLRNHKVTAHVHVGNATQPVGNSPGCITDARPSTC